MKQYQETIEKIKEAIKQQPENAEMWCSWGVALVEWQQYQEAGGKFQKALEVKPDFVPALYGCGFALTALGRKEEAQAERKKVAGTITQHGMSPYKLFHDKLKEFRIKHHK